MKVHREEGRFTIRLELSAEFDASYEGDDDGFAWLENWKNTVRPKVVRAVFDALRSEGNGARYDAIPTSRGANPDDELEISIRWREQ
jgi:hypothetical protein